MRILIYAAGLSACFLFFGCAGHNAPAVPAPSVSGHGLVSTNAPLIITPEEEELIGKVASVNANLRFVVITFPVSRMAAIGQRLNVYRHGLKVGEVKISGPQSDDSSVADIIAGDAEAGDAVRVK